MFLSEFLPKYGRERREILVHGGMRTGREAVTHETGKGDYHTVRKQLEGRKDILETLLPDSIYVCLRLIYLRFFLTYAYLRDQTLE